MGHGLPDDERRTRVWSRVRRFAAADRDPAGVHHVALAATVALHAGEAVVYQVSAPGRGEPAWVLGPLGDRLSEAEVTLGEGPALDCLRAERPVVVTDLAAPGSAARWPVFTPFARAEGVAGVVAFPIMAGAAVLGCLEALRPVAAPCTEGEAADGVLLADAAMVLLLRGPARSGAHPFSDAVEARWAIVRRATGVVAVQTRGDLETAFVRMRAYAYGTGRRLGDVAADVLLRDLRFGVDPGVDPGVGPEAGPETDQG
ncbi:GAF and ANTAR domain-containing protein [Actinosynnema sp. NPDC050436]|uniref:GAF and ANTAR domain-containing protein n=1 Tax=Actinosynnema sp. NPDC050436 TaxID=3155659 RepID=UPI0033E489B8